DEGVYAGWTVPMEYDPLLGKLIAWGSDRVEALARLRRALGEYRVTGIKTNVGLFRRILADPEFARGEIHTRWLEESQQATAARFVGGENRLEAAAVLAAVLWHVERNGASAASGQRVGKAESRWQLKGRREQIDRAPER